MTESQSLESELIAGYKQHVAGKIDDAMVKYQGGITYTARQLGFAQSTISDWRNQQRAIPWKQYFDLMLRIDEVEDDFLVPELVSGLQTYFSESIRDYCRAHGIGIPELADRLSKSPSTLNGWKGHRSIASPEEMLGAMAFLYVGAADAKTILKPIIQYGILVDQSTDVGSVADITNSIYLASQGLDTKVPEELQELLSTLEGYESDDPLERAHLMRALLASLGDHVEYFRNKGVSGRALLRTLCAPQFHIFGMTAMETRQMLRDEKYYEEWLEMNPPEDEEDDRK